MSDSPRILFGAEAAVPEAGGKGAALAKLAETFPVPAFFVIGGGCVRSGGDESGRADKC